MTFDEALAGIREHGKAGERAAFYLIYPDGDDCSSQYVRFDITGTILALAEEVERLRGIVAAEVRLDREPVIPDYSSWLAKPLPAVTKQQQDFFDDVGIKARAYAESTGQFCARPHWEPWNRGNAVNVEIYRPGQPTLYNVRIGIDEPISVLYERMGACMRDWAVKNHCAVNISAEDLAKIPDDLAKIQAAFDGKWHPVKDGVEPDRKLRAFLLHYGIESAYSPPTGYESRLTIHAENNDVDRQVVWIDYIPSHADGPIIVRAVTVDISQLDRLGWTNSAAQRIISAIKDVPSKNTTLYAADRHQWPHIDLKATAEQITDEVDLLALPTGSADTAPPMSSVADTDGVVEALDWSKLEDGKVHLMPALNWSEGCNLDILRLDVRKQAESHEPESEGDRMMKFFREGS